MNATRNRQAGLTLIELMVALAIGSFLIIGAVQIYTQSRQAFRVNESIARVQETAQFAMDTIEADLRMASNWGRTSRSLTIEGRSISGDPNPDGLAEPGDCGDGWALDLAMTVDGTDNNYGLAGPSCTAQGGAEANSDVITVRRATVDPVVPDGAHLQVQSSRIQGQLFVDNNIPAGYSAAVDPVTGEPDSTTHNLIVNSYYVAADSNLIPNTPTLRRKTLGVVAGAPGIIDQEIAPGVENLQVQFGVDVDEDNTVDMYVNPGDAVYDPDAAGYIPGARVITARVWLVVRGVEMEVGIQDQRDYDPGNIDLGTYNDNYRRVEISKTILLRNART
jgi:type IV pilus assembly protein PilW